MPIILFRLEVENDGKQEKPKYSHSKKTLKDEAVRVSRKPKHRTSLVEVMYEQLPFKQQIAAALNDTEPVSTHTLGVWREGKAVAFR